MLELYHGTTSVCAQKVRLTLAEKRLEWQTHLLELNVDHLTPDYLKINPNGVVPTLVHNGTIIVESTVIIHYLDHLFPGPPLMPRAPVDRTRAHLFKKLMDEYIHPACIVYTFATANRGRFAGLSPEQRAEQYGQKPAQPPAAPGRIKARRRRGRHRIAGRKGSDQELHEVAQVDRRVVEKIRLARRPGLFAGRHRRHSLHDASGNVAARAPVGSQAGRRSVVGARQSAALLR